ncbi:MAG: AzlD domain-containing protein [Myxococcales bacterium]
MSAGWLLVILVGASSIAIKAACPLLLGGRPVPASLVPVLRLLAPALFGALVVTQAFAHGRELTVDARLGGVLVAAIGAYLGAPTVAVVVGAAAVTAALRFFVR